MLFKNDDSVTHKRNKKKLSKRHLFKRIHFDLVKYNDEGQLLNILYKSLLTAKKRHSSEYGVIFDTNVIIHDITFIPEFPDKYDVVCLESELESYRNTNDKSLYWTATNILSSGNFIINGSSLDKVLDVIKASKNISEFYNNLNTLNIFSITQTHFSEQKKNYIHDPRIINNKLTEQDILEYDSKLSNEFYSRFSNLNLSIDKHQSLTIKDDLLPKISLICPFTNKNKFFHTLLTFLKLDYPKHLLEFVIIDDTNSEKELNLPEDKRFRLININNTQGTDSLPLGYKLNTGVKHASNELILHFFDTNHYNTNLRKLVGHFILSKKECIMSIDTGLYNKHTSTSVQLPDLANCLYTKTFWKKCSFEELSHNFSINVDLIHKWVASRIKEVSFIPFIYVSFKLVDKENLKRIFVEQKECSLNLSILVDKKIKESFDLLLTQL